MSSVAAAVGVSPAVAGQKQTLTDLQKIADTQVSKNTKVANNQYLKWARYQGEEPRGVPTNVGSVVLDLGTVFDMGCLYHEKKGPWFSFTDSSVEGKFESWSPAQFITGLPKERLTEMKLDTEGVLSLEICCDNTIIDFNLKHAMKNTEHPYPKDVDPPMWDFVLTRGDGVQFLLHPSYKKDKGKGTLLDDKKKAQRTDANGRNMKLQQWFW